MCHNIYRHVEQDRTLHYQNHKKIHAADDKQTIIIGLMDPVDNHTIFYNIVTFGIIISNNFDDRFVVCICNRPRTSDAFWEIFDSTIPHETVGMVRSCMLSEHGTFWIVYNVKYCYFFDITAILKLVQLYLIMNIIGVALTFRWK